MLKQLGNIKVPLLWLTMIVLGIKLVFNPLSGDYGLFAVLALIIGCFALAAGTVYRALAKNALTCHETFCCELYEAACFSFVLWSVISELGLGYGIFTGNIGAVRMILAYIAVILYFVLCVLNASVRRYNCQHYQFS